MKPDEAIEALRAAWPEHGCGAGDCCLRRPGGQVVGACRCVRDWKDHPGVQPVYRLLDAARRVIEAPHEPPPSLDAALAVLVDRAATQAEGGTGEVARPLREAVARLLPRMWASGPMVPEVLDWIGDLPLAGRWTLEDGGTNMERWSLDGRLLAIVERRYRLQTGRIEWWALSDAPGRPFEVAGFDGRAEAGAHCDAGLVECGYILIGPPLGDEPRGGE